MVDYSIVRAQQQGHELSISLANLEKAFDTVSCQYLMEVLLAYGVHKDMVEVVQGIYINITG